MLGIKGGKGAGNNGGSCYFIWGVGEGFPDKMMFDQISKHIVWL